MSKITNLESPLGKLPDKWQISLLKDITIKIGSGATPKGGQSVYLTQRQKFALIRSQNVFDRFFNSQGLAYISEEHAIQLQNVFVQPGDLLLNITGDGITFSRATQVPTEILPACVNQHVAIIRPDNQKCCSGYLLAYLTHPVIKKYIESFNAGGSRRAITKGHIESFLIPLPPLSEQQAITHILGSLDDKIELNRQMNETLEGFARTLFKSWFVDFDPVRAKMEGRLPFGMDAETAALFPDGFEDSRLGEIPKGWKVTKFIDFISINRTSLEPLQHKKEFFNHYSIPAFDTDCLPKIEIGDQIKSNKFLVLKNTVLLSKINPTIPRVWLPFVQKSQYRSICSTEFLVLLAKKDISAEYLYTFLKTSHFQERFISLVTGTSNSHQRVKPNDLLNMDFLMPSSDLNKCFNTIVQPLCRNVQYNLTESQTLSTLRDTLLPKLLSGEIRVKQAEKEVGAVL